MFSKPQKDLVLSYLKRKQKQIPSKPQLSWKLEQSHTIEFQEQKEESVWSREIEVVEEEIENNSEFEEKT